MATVFDYVTVACFLAMAGAFLDTDRPRARTLLHLFGGRDRLRYRKSAGDAGYTLMAVVLIITSVVLPPCRFDTGIRRAELGLRCPGAHPS